MPELLNAGDEIEVADAFVVSGFAVYSGAASHDPDQPAIPIVLADLEGYFQSELPLPPGAASTRKIRLMFEERGANATAVSMLNSVRQLANLRRNQERP